MLKWITIEIFKHIAQVNHLLVCQ